LKKQERKNFKKSFQMSSKVTFLPEQLQNNAQNEKFVIFFGAKVPNPWILYNMKMVRINYIKISHLGTFKNLKFYTIFQK